MSRVSRYGLLALLLLHLGSALHAGRLRVAEEGVAAVDIVLPDRPTLQETTAAAELADYLERITGAPFVTVGEAARDGVRPAIFVGATRAAREAGIDLESQAPEDWSWRPVREGLVLAGGTPRGTLYAVAHWLEEVAGVRWWNPFEEDWPRRRRWAVRTEPRDGRPAFVYRDVYGIGDGVFAARCRLNGHAAPVPWARGGAEDYGPPHQAHTFYSYVPPRRHFEAHPEWYSEIAGLRVGSEAQLCLTDEGLRREVVNRLRGFIAEGEAEARREGRPPPRLYGLSPNDWGGACGCRECRHIVAAEGAESGNLLRFVNHVADAIADDHPKILVDTLAYYHTLEPPSRVRPRDNVVVRLSGLQSRDYAHGVTHPANDDYRRIVEAWAERTPHLRIWDYTVTFGLQGSFPLPNLGYLADDLRFYRDVGVEGLFVQHNHPVMADLRDLKLWVLTRLLEDPDRSVRGLVRDFTEGFYGRAGRPLRRYLGLLAAQARRPDSRVGFEPLARDIAYLDLPFLAEATRRFDRAARRAGDDPTASRRVRHARMTVDRSILFRWPALVEAWRAGDGPRRFPFDLEQVLDRYRRTFEEQIAMRVPQAGRADALADWEAELAALRAWISSFGDRAVPGDDPRAG